VKDIWEEADKGETALVVDAVTNIINEGLDAEKKRARRTEFENLSRKRVFDEVV